MEPVVTTCVGCGKAIRIRRPDLDLRRVCPICRTPLHAPSSGAKAPDPEPATSVPGVGAAVRRRLLVGSIGLRNLTAALMLAAPLALWSTAAWTSAAPWSASPLVAAPASSVRAGDGFMAPDGPSKLAIPRVVAALVSTDDPTGARAKLLRFAAKAARLPAGIGLVEAATERVAAMAVSTPARAHARGALRFLPFFQAASQSPAKGDSLAEPRSLNSSLQPLLTPPDFGAPSEEELVAACPTELERRFTIRDEDGRQVVARLHGHHEGKSVLMLPDGRLGIPSMLVPTDEPFHPATMDEVAEGLLTGPFADFAIHRTEHYLILHQSANGDEAGGSSGETFAKTNGVLLEELYRRLIGAFRKHDVTAHEAEFPLVAVIFPTEAAFRAYRPVAADVQAYYEIYSNRIFLYERPTGDRSGPEVDALLRPQMVAHEGTHQILQNIGVQPRLGSWPLWLVEGLAEYCATPVSPRKGQPSWDGLGQINNLHMATLRELEDPVSLSMPGNDAGAKSKSLFRAPGQPLVEAMIRRAELTPTEYALAWAITHYLAMKRSEDFTRYLRILAASPPLEPKSADDHVEEFRDVFGADLAKLDKTIHAYLTKLTKQKGYDPMPYYAVLFQQPLPNGLLRRAAMVSQSPQLIRQWIDEMSNPAANLPNWQASPYTSRARATLAVQDWIRGE